MYWCVGSERTGPGPPGGAMNSSSCASQPVVLVGAKSGTASAASAEPETTQMSNARYALRTTDPCANCDMAIPVYRRHRPYRGPPPPSSLTIAFPQRLPALL